jgi:hypothetical protein
VGRRRRRPIDQSDHADVTPNRYVPVGVSSSSRWVGPSPSIRKESGMFNAQKAVDQIEALEDDHIVRGLD